MTIAEAISFSILMSVCICMTIVGNILVILSVFTYRPLRSVQNFFIVSLAVADLAVAILVMPFNVANFVIGRWMFGAIFCNMWLTFDILTCTASILNLCAIALDRYYAIHDPIRYAQKRTLKRVLVSIAVVWAASALISVPPLIGWNNSSGNTLYNENTQKCELTNEKGFVIYSASGSFYIPLFIMTFVYVNIFRATRRRLRARAKAAAASKLKKPSSDESPEHTTACTSCKSGSKVAHDKNSNKHLKNGAKARKTATALKKSGGARSKIGLFVQNKDTRDALHPAEAEMLTASREVIPEKEAKPPPPVPNQMHQFLEERQKISLSKERRAARTMGIIMGAFVACWLPFFLMYIIFPFCDACTASADHRFTNFIVWLGYINSALNPIIYTIFNIDFRRAFKILLQGKCRT
ncbi:hypothetical protein CAPTEDRAFT_110759 [Capitella teleta]|uniref:G-protein coupled receptors family 1 profile domain-containing protein n=1 Tax=Capitella teleta TaxID=283909 RepID=R7TLN0_CAPTE|nr:hypothetical protein CAPTEDRAFT_110759 [Capitella teleta]|eukprot:ELT94407.1 hypothetical protein CAPTEDRAFT_110759 [Capitella teleta]